MKKVNWCGIGMLVALLGTLVAVVATRASLLGFTDTVYKEFWSGVALFIGGLLIMFSSNTEPETDEEV